MKTTERRGMWPCALAGLVLGWAVGAAPGRAIEPCVGGMAGVFPCADVDLLGHLTEADLGTVSASDNWGWTDPVTGTEYALVAAREGTIFVDLSDPEAPFVVGSLPSHSGPNNPIRDVKVFADHAFIVAGILGHGMQVFDLTQLRDVNNPPETFAETAHYDGISDAHNIAINESTGFAYAVLDSGSCMGGLHMIDISVPLLPSFAACFSDQLGIHDAQCVVYAGPDAVHQGKEICFTADLPDRLGIVDVTDKANPVELADVAYAGGSIAHQGWLTEDHAFFIFGDEGDENDPPGHNTKTYVWDVRDLDAPFVAGEYLASTAATDHNQYVRGSRVFQANYRAGFRVLQIVDAATGTLEEVGYLDSQPGNDTNDFIGAWSVYPFFESGIVIGTDRTQGLFVLQPTAIFSDGFESGDTSAWSGGIVGQ